MAEFVTKNINQLIKIVKDSDYKVFVNVNAPSVKDIKDFKGVKYCTALCIKDDCSILISPASPIRMIRFSILCAKHTVMANR